MDETIEATIARIQGSNVTYGCRQCGHRHANVEAVDRWPDGSPTRHTMLRLVCPACGYRDEGAYIDPRPHYPPEVAEAHRLLDDPTR